MKFVFVLTLCIAFAAVISAQNSKSSEDGGEDDYDWGLGGLGVPLPAIKYRYNYNVHDPKTGGQEGGYIQGGTDGRYGLGYYSSTGGGLYSRRPYGPRRGYGYGNSGRYGRFRRNSGAAKASN